MNADYRYVIAMEKYVALQKINKEECLTVKNQYP